MFLKRSKQADATAEQQPASPSVNELANVERAARARLDAARVAYGRAITTNLPSSEAVAAAAAELDEAANAHAAAASTLATSTEKAMDKRRAAVLALCKEREKVAGEFTKHLQLAGSVFAELKRVDAELVAHNLGRECEFSIGPAVVSGYLGVELNRVFQPNPNAPPPTTLAQRIDAGIGVIRRVIGETNV
jgi:hypothetical protein